MLQHYQITQDHLYHRHRCREPLLTGWSCCWRDCRGLLAAALLSGCLPVCCRFAAHPLPACRHPLACSPDCRPPTRRCLPAKPAANQAVFPIPTALANHVPNPTLPRPPVISNIVEACCQRCQRCQHRLPLLLQVLQWFTVIVAFFATFVAFFATFLCVV